MGTTDGRRAFTLVELTVAAAAAAVLLVAVYGMFTTGLRTFRRQESMTEGLQAAALAYQIIVDDLRRIPCYGVEAADPSSLQPVVIGDGADGVANAGRSLSFLRLEDLDETAGPPQATSRRVTYRLVDGGGACRHLARRDGEGAEEVFESIRLHDGWFRLRRDRDPAGRPLLYVELRLAGHGTQGDHTWFVGLVALECATRRLQAPYWIAGPHPTGR